MVKCNYNIYSTFRDKISAIIEWSNDIARLYIASAKSPCKSYVISHDNNVKLRYNVGYHGFMPLPNDDDIYHIIIEYMEDYRGTLDDYITNELIPSDELVCKMDKYICYYKKLYKELKKVIDK